MRATSEGKNEANILMLLCFKKGEKEKEKRGKKRKEQQNEANILMSLCFEKDQILISVSVFIITIPFETATAYYHCTCSVHFIHTMQFQLYVRISKIFFIF